MITPLVEVGIGFQFQYNPSALKGWYLLWKVFFLPDRHWRQEKNIILTVLSSQSTDLFQFINMAIHCHRVYCVHKSVFQQKMKKRLHVIFTVELNLRTNLCWCDSHPSSWRLWWHSWTSWCKMSSAQDSCLHKSKIHTILHMLSRMWTMKSWKWREPVFFLVCFFLMWAMTKIE